MKRLLVMVRFMGWLSPAFRLVHVAAASTTIRRPTIRQKPCCRASGPLKPAAEHSALHEGSAMDRFDDRVLGEASAAPTAALALGRALGAPADAADREVRLYARYVQALALLCECAPFVDDEDVSE